MTNGDDNKDAIIESMAKLVSGFQIHTRTQIDKFVFAEGTRDEAECFLRAGGSLEEAMATFDHEYLGQEVEEHNVFLNEGIDEIWLLVTGGAATAYNNANAEVGTGTSATAENPTQTGLLGSPVYVGMDGSYPLGAGSGQDVDFRGTFGSGVANQVWAEFSTSNGAGDAGENLHRTVSAQGTKTSGQTWVLTITLSAT